MDMEPLLPSEGGESPRLALALIRGAEQLQVSITGRLVADQVEGMLNRMVGYGTWIESAKELPGGSAPVLRGIFLRGEIARGEVPRIIEASQRTAQKSPVTC